MQQAAMFQTEDLPLFSGSAQRARVETFKPQPVHRQLPLPRASRDDIWIVMPWIWYDGMHSRWDGKPLDLADTPGVMSLRWYIDSSWRV